MVVRETPDAGRVDTPQIQGRRGSLLAARLRGEGTAGRRAWRGRYVRRIAVGDAMCAAAAGAVGYVVRFGTDVEPSAQQPSLWAAVLLPAVWSLSMLIARSYEQRFLWIGAEEY